MKKKKLKRQKYSIKNALSDAKYMISFIWKSDKSLFTLKLIEILLSCFSILINMFSLKIIIDQLLSNNSFRDIIFTIVILQLITQIIFSFQLLVVNVLIPRKEYQMRNSLQNIFIKKATQLDLKNYEDTKFYDDYTKVLKMADSKALNYLDFLKDIISSVLNLIISLMLVSFLNIYIVLFIIIIAIITIYDQNKSLKLSSKLYEAEETINRSTNYIKKISHEVRYAKEVRIFNLTNFLIDKINYAFNKKYKFYKNTNGRYWRLKYFVSFIRDFLIVIGLFIYIAFLVVIRKELSVGDFSLVITSVLSISNYIGILSNSLEDLKFQGEYYVSHLKKILECKIEIENYTSDLKLDSNCSHTIEFKDVWFKYPNHEKIILKGINFKIEKGEKVSIVGRNGVGKSTIVKLLLRLYDVTSGQILIDDVDIKKYDIVSLRKCFSVLMQDYNIYSFTVFENIMMNQYNKKDEEIVNNSLKMFHLNQYISEFGNPQDVYINREFDEKGIYFSGGQSQQLAIIRALTLGGSITLFDEPNSSLDPVAEYELNLQILNKINNKTIIFITHRLTTAIMCNNILYIQEGMVMEQGDHNSLIQKNGKYADMFHKQNAIFKIIKELEDAI